MTQVAQPNQRTMWVFGIIWLGQLLSLIGSGLTGFTLGVRVYQASGSVTQFALISLFTTLPGVLIAPLGGALADRWNRRWVMLLSDSGAALSTVLLLVLVSNNELNLGVIYAATALSAACNAIQWPAYSAAITLLVPQGQLGRANGLVQIGEALAQVVAPALAGVLLLQIGLRGVLLLDLATFGCAFVTLLSVRIPDVARTSTSAEPKPMRHEISAGWQYLRSRPALLALLVFFAITNFTLGMVTVLLSPLILSFTNAAVLGTIMSLGGVGAVLGGILMTVWGGPKRRVTGILGAVLIQGLLLFLGGLRPNVPLVTIATFVFLACIPIVYGCSQATWQTHVPVDLQGRVFALRRMIAMSAAPLAYLLAGPLTEGVFEPLVATNGPLASSIGSVIGTGPGRGIGLLLIVLGIFTVSAVAIGAAYRPLRELNQLDQPRPEK